MCDLIQSARQASGCPVHISACRKRIPVFDRDGHAERKKRLVAKYSEALRRAVMQDQLWAAEFDFVSKRAR